MKINLTLICVLISIACFASLSVAWRRRRRCDTSHCAWVWESCSRSCEGGRQAPRITRNQGACGSCNLPAARTCNTQCCSDAHKSRNALVCHQNASCSSSSVCKCNSGFAGNGYSCTDIDECITSTHNCDKNTSECSNEIGSFECICNSGYTGHRRRSCSNVDECIVEKHDCHQHADCIDSVGNYTCSCREGYVGNGVTCEDVNECLNPASCHQTANCSNTVGSFFCFCKPGFIGDAYSLCSERIHNDTSSLANQDIKPAGIKLAMITIGGVIVFLVVV